MNLVSFFAVASFIPVISKACDCGKTFFDLRIYGGRESKPNRYPWLVAIVNTTTEKLYCSGSILSESWILTAAHCFPDLTRTDFKLNLGAHDFRQPLDTRQAKRIILHEKYNGLPQQHNDIALIELTTPIKFEKRIKPLCIPKPSQPMKEDFRVAGWGRVNNKSLPFYLVDVNIYRRTDEHCIDWWGGAEGYDPSIQFCAGEGQGTCDGDSGGPLLTLQRGRYFIEGIVSYGYDPCDVSVYPGVFTKVRTYLDWIKSKMSGESYCSPY